MDGLAFLGIIASYTVVLIWYVANAAAGSPGESGLLAIAAPDAPPPRRYRIKPMAGAFAKPSRVEQRESPAPKSYARKSIRKRAYRHANASGYRRCNAAPRYTVRSKAQAAAHSVTG